eukprot:scaffold240907_cov44-Prasinocladus_malaysianus.AAC.1
MAKLAAQRPQTWWWNWCACAGDQVARASCCSVAMRLHALKAVDRRLSVTGEGANAIDCIIWKYWIA